METRAEAHKVLGNLMLENGAKPLKVLNESQNRIRKQSENATDKAAKNLSDWRAAEAKSKKHSHTCARENEKLQDAMIDNRASKSTIAIPLQLPHKINTEKDIAKLEGKRKKVEDAMKKADVEYYSHCVRSERARLDWECAVFRGVNIFHELEEERLVNLKQVLCFYLKNSSALTPKLSEATNKLIFPIDYADASKDISTFSSLKQSSQQCSEQLLPDFYCEHITLAMNRERRKQALTKLLQLIRQDIEREAKSKNGLENLSKAIKVTANFNANDSEENVAERMFHINSMLTYLEGAKYKIQTALSEIDSVPKKRHLLAPYITITRDKAGLQQSVLKVPAYMRQKCTESIKSDREFIAKLDTSKEEAETIREWIERGSADGNSNHHDESDFDDFSSKASSENGHPEEPSVKPIAKCKVLYDYKPNLPDELAIKTGDMVSVYRQQEDGWCLGECNGEVGIFPATYVENLPA